MFVLVGLGNPGSEYQANRHNLGFMAIDSIHSHYGFEAWHKKFDALIARATIDGQKVLLIKPQTFMNLSGPAVSQALRFYKLDSQNLIVFYDDLDIDTGKIKIKVGGSSGGHNGIKSIDMHCANDYKRIRLGIGHPGDKTMVNKWVLGDFSAPEQQIIEPLLSRLSENLPLLLKAEDSQFIASLTKTGQPRSQSGTKTPSFPSAGKGTPAQKPSTNKMAELLKHWLHKDKN